ncbi:MAG: Crp/Fnr family transcriptional regulator [Candidatus Sumerlaeia bacterium]
MERLTASSDDKIDFLAACPLFEELAADQLDALAAMAELRQYKSGETLFFQGDDVDGFFVVVRGQVKACRYGADGREQILHVLYDGEPVGEVPVFQGGGSFPASAIAVESSQCLYFPKGKFLKLGRQHPDLLIAMLAILSRRLHRFVELIDSLSLSEVPARLARYILEEVDREAESWEFELSGTKAMLASRIGTIPETLSRCLGRMQKKGIIQVQGRKIRVMDADGLFELADGEKL